MMKNRMEQDWRLCKEKFLPYFLTILSKIKGLAVPIRAFLNQLLNHLRYGRDFYEGITVKETVTFVSQMGNKQGLPAAESLMWKITFLSPNVQSHALLIALESITQKVTARYINQFYIWPYVPFSSAIEAVELYRQCVQWFSEHPNQPFVVTYRFYNEYNETDRKTSCRLTRTTKVPDVLPSHVPLDWPTVARFDDLKEQEIRMMEGVSKHAKYTAPLSGFFEHLCKRYRVLLAPYRESIVFWKEQAGKDFTDVVAADLGHKLMLFAVFWRYGDLSPETATLLAPLFSDVLANPAISEVIVLTDFQPTESKTKTITFYLVFITESNETSDFLIKEVVDTTALPSKLRLVKQTEDRFSP